MTIENLILVSNGPGANRLPPMMVRDAIVAGVTTAATRWRCDWWVMCDAQTYIDSRARVMMAPDGLPPRIFARSNAIEGVETMTRRPVRPGERILYHEDIGLRGFDVPHGRRWNQWSGIAAMGLAWHLRPATVRLYGFDLVGTDDCAGTQGDSRREDRWVVERDIMRAWVALLRSAGIVVKAGSEMQWM